MIHRCTTLALLVLLFAGGVVGAQDVQSLDSVRAAAVSGVRAQLPESRGKYFLSAAALDSRLRLNRCGAPLESVPPSGGNAGARITVGVRCNTGNPWTIYVPVTIEVEMPVVVLRRGLTRDARVSAADVEKQTRRVSGSGVAFVSDIAQLQGRHLKRALIAGTPLTLDMLAVDVMIRRGQQVTLLAQTGSVEIRAQGHALTDGGARDRIRVQNTTSHKIVEGVVENAGTVRVEM